MGTVRPTRALNYYGSKVQAAHLYPPPRHRVIVEPFCGGAGYSLLHRRYDVHLFDLNPTVILAWQYLIATDGKEILRLPILAPGEAVPIDIPIGAMCLIGWNTTICGSRPQGNLVPSAARVPSSFWGPSKRAALAHLADEIKHWHATVADYRTLPNGEATWFVDPPYFGPLGSHYPNGSGAIDYDHLSMWCQSRHGQTIVCEGPDARWLPFRPHHDHVSAPTADVVGRRRSTEVIWTSP